MPDPVRFPRTNPSLMYVSGPIKSKLHRELGSTNSQFSLMISALK